MEDKIYTQLELNAIVSEMDRQQKALVERNLNLALALHRANQIIVELKQGVLKPEVEKD